MSPEPRPPLATHAEFAALLDSWLVRPEFPSAHVLAGLRSARDSGVATVIVRPCDLDLAVRTLQGSPVKPGSVAGFPHGSHTTAVKLYEVRDLLRRGARQVDLVVALPNLLSREFQHVQTELMQASEACHKEGATLTVILETALLADDLKIIACGCCERAEVDCVATSTGFASGGYTLPDATLLRRHLPEEIGVQASGGIVTIDQVLEAYQAGCARAATDSAAAILDQWKARSAATS